METKLMMTHNGYAINQSNKIYKKTFGHFYTPSRNNPNFAPSNTILHTFNFIFTTFRQKCHNFHTFIFDDFLYFFLSTISSTQQKIVHWQFVSNEGFIKFYY